MSKKRVNFGSVATSEAARRELMKPVTAWERAWVTPDGSKVRVRQWVQTHKAPEWSDDEADSINQPLAPILDVEVIDMEEDEDAVEGGEGVEAANTKVSQSAAQPETAPLLDVPPLDASLAATPQDDDIPELGAELTLDPTLEADPGELLVGHDLTGDLAVPDLAGGLVGPDMDFDALAPTDPMDLLPPDGTAFEAVHDLSQMEEGDDLLGGKEMDASTDPFVGVS